MWPKGDAARYGGSVPSQYGGTFVEDGLMVMLFTADLAEHERALTELLEGRPDGLRLRRAARTWQEVEHSNAEVQRQLMIETPHPDVFSVGIGVHEGQFVIRVGISPYTPDSVRAVKAAVTPHAIVVVESGPAYRGGPPPLRMGRPGRRGSR